MYQLTSPSGKNWHKNFLLFSRVFPNTQLTKDMNYLKSQIIIENKMIANTKKNTPFEIIL